MQRSAFVISQSACAMAEIEAMRATNMEVVGRAHSLGVSVHNLPYQEQDFKKLN